MQCLMTHGKAMCSPGAPASVGPRGEAPRPEQRVTNPEGAGATFLQVAPRAAQGPGWHIRVCLSVPGLCRAVWRCRCGSEAALLHPQGAHASDGARMLSAFMVMFGFLISFPNRRREKRAEPRAGRAPLIPCLRLCTCLALPAACALPVPCPARGTLVGSHRARGQRLQRSGVVAPWQGCSVGCRGELCPLSFRWDVQTCRREAQGAATPGGSAGWDSDSAGAETGNLWMETLPGALRGHRAPHRGAWQPGRGGTPPQNDSPPLLMRSLRVWGALPAVEQHMGRTPLVSPLLILTGTDSAAIGDPPSPP